MSFLFSSGLRSTIPDSGIFLDGWADNKLSSRDSYSTTSFEGTEPSTSNYTSPERPNWTNQGTGTASVSGSALQMPSDIINNGTVVTTAQGANVGSNFTTWEIAAPENVAPSGGRFDMGMLVQDTTSYYGLPSNGYALSLSYDNDKIELLKIDNQTETILFDTTYSFSTTDTYSVERDSNGNFEVFANGSSLGTASDTTFTSSSYTWISSYSLPDAIDVPIMRVF